MEICLRIVLILVCLLSFSFEASALESFKCKNQIIRLNTSLSEVELRCGDPSKKNSWLESSDTTKTILEKTSSHPATEQHVITQNSRQQKSVDELVYNFGSSEFLYILRFENGSLMKIETSGYGF